MILIVILAVPVVCGLRRVFVGFFLLFYSQFNFSEWLEIVYANTKSSLLFLFQLFNFEFLHYFRSHGLGILSIFLKKKKIDERLFVV